MKKIVSLVCGSLMALSLASCSNGSATYQITFYDDAQNVLEVNNVSEGKMPSYSKGTPTKEATESTIYTFNGWIPEIKAATSNASYVASFKAELRKYQITFDSDGGTITAPITVEWGKRISGVANPTKSDSEHYKYTFLYWYDITGSEETPFKMSTEIKRDYSLRAKWAESARSYTVSFNTHGGSLVNSQKITYGQCATKPNDPTHDSSLSSNYTFDGWYSSSDYAGNKFDFETPITSNIELHAKWIETTRQYVVKFYSGDDVYETKQVNYNSKVSAPSVNPTKATDEVGEYTFDSWDFDFNEPITGNVDIHAIYDINYIYYHYTKVDSTCTLYGCKDFYGTKAELYSMDVPEEYYDIVESGAAPREMIDEIALNDEHDERLIKLAHEFDEISGKCIHSCGVQSITGSAVDVSKLSRTEEYECPINYGNMYKYDGYAKDIFTAYSLEGLTEVRFYLVNPDVGNTFILKGDASNCMGGIYGGPSTYDGIIARKDGDNWTVTRASGKTMFAIVGGSFSKETHTSYTVSSPSTLNEIFDTFTYAKVMYISDIIVEGTPSEQKEVLQNAYYVGKTNNKTYVLTNTGEKISGLGNKYTYACLYGDTTYESAFRELFNDIDITNFKTISFYIDLHNNKYLTFVDDNGSDANDSGAYGLHPLDGANVPGIIKAYNEGNGTWRVTATGFKFRKISDGSKVSEFTYHNRNTLKALFTIGNSNSYQQVAMSVSDVIISK